MTSRSLLKGISLTIVSWSLFAIMNACAKHASSQISFTITLFFQNSVALLLLSPLFFCSDISFFNEKNAKLLLARGVLGVLVFICLFFSLPLIPLTDALLLANTGPLFLPFILYFWLKQKTSPRLWLSVLIGFLGVISIVQPSAQIFHFGSLFALLSGCLTGIVMVILRQLSSEDSRRVVLSYLCMATLSSLPLALPFFSSISIKALPSLFLVGTFFGIGQWTYTRALSYADSLFLAPFSYVFIVVGVLIDWLFWNRTPTIGTTIGIFLIFTGGILTIFWAKPTTLDQPIANPTDSTN